MYEKIISFVSDRICANQFGFLRNRSSVSQLLLSFSSIINGCEQGYPTDQIFRKAFDSVSHSILLYKLWAFGITGPLWQWFRGYLLRRQHFVEIDSCSSGLLPVHYYVGSILGPLLFIIFINDIPGSSLHSSMFLFADDSKLQKAISSSSGPSQASV